RQQSRPQDLVSPAEERDHHGDENRQDEPGPAAPPAAVRRTREPAGGLRDGHQPCSPAIAVSTASLSTTPTIRPSSTAQTGFSLWTITGTALRTVVRTSRRGPSSSPAAGSRMIQRSVSTWLRGMSRTK